jgi:hypothetical protein
MRKRGAAAFSLKVKLQSEPQLPLIARHVICVYPFNAFTLPSELNVAEVTVAPGCPN